MDQLSVIQRGKDFVSSPYRSERQKLICIRRWHVKKFFQTIDKVEDFLDYDQCFRLADRYLIAMVFTYFLRARLEPEEYTKENFFVALCLAHNVEEDDSTDMLDELLYWFDSSKADLMQQRDKFFRRIEYRGAVSRTCCDIVMRSVKPDHKIWRRHRHVNHSGVLNSKDNTCPSCVLDSSLEDSS